MATKYIWWEHARKMVRVFPINEQRYKDAVNPSTSPSLSGMPHSGAIADQTLDLIADMESQEWYREYKAVQQALDHYKRKSYGTDLMKFVKLYYWSEKRLKMDDIALKIHVSPDTIRYWNRLLIRAVAHNRGWL